jgi:hypothetical protein
LSDLAARALLLSHRTRVSRDRAIEPLGLRLEYPRVADVDDYALVFLAMMVLMSVNVFTDARVTWTCAAGVSRSLRVRRNYREDSHSCAVPESFVWRPHTRSCRTPSYR